MKRVVIVGGGIAGSFLANQLGSSDYQVIVFDHSLPREKPCGGALNPLIFTLFPWLKEMTPWKQETYNLRFISVSEDEIVIPFKTPVPIVSRREFDSALLERALHYKNIQFIRERVISVENGQEHWQVYTRNHQVAADILVGADGSNSLIRKKVLKNRRERFALALGCFLEAGKADTITVKMYADFGGYAWHVPRSDHASVGIVRGYGRGPSSEMRDRLAEFIREYAPNSQVRERWTALIPSAGSPSYFDIACSGPNWVLIGDAAGHVHPVTGEGIFYAFCSADAAASAILQGDTRTYDRLWRTRYGNTLRNGGEVMEMILRMGGIAGLAAYQVMVKRFLGLRYRQTS
jgi:geranylgeranyl reductase family protein